MGQELKQLTINSELNWNPDVKFLMEVNLILVSMLIAENNYHLVKKAGWRVWKKDYGEWNNNPG